MLRITKQNESRARWVLWIAALCFIAGLTVIDLQPALAQRNCPDGNCDEITIDTPAFNCYRFQIKNYGFGTNKKISRIQFSTDNAHLMQWICSFSVPNNWDETGNPSGPTDVNFEKWVEDTTPTRSSSITNCQTKEFTICFCCLENKQDFTFPLTIKTFYFNGLGMVIGSCEQTFNLNVKKTSDCQVWECEEPCNALTVEPFHDNETNEEGFCATIIQQTAGELREFSLDFDCISTHGASTLRGWRLKSMPAGWHNSSISDTSIVFVDTGNVTGKNCDTVTFCFLSDGCGDFCDSMLVSLHTNAQVDTCDVSALLVLPETDESCCEGAIGVSDPVQDQVTGVWDMCVKVHRIDASSMNTITICVASTRCIELESIADGWELTSISPANCYNFTRTTAPNTGCRTFQFCFKTCDCLDEETTATFTITGENITPAPPPIVKTIPADAGTCCDDVWHKRDELTVTQTSSNCLTFTMLNSHYTCSDLNDFHFDISGVPCQVISVTVPNGFVWQQIGNVIHVTPALISGGVIECCESMSVVVCFDCFGPVSPFSTHWWSTFNGSTVTDTTETVLGAGPIAPPLKVGEKPWMQDQQNYPNPFGASTQFKTTIPFETDGAGTAEITIMDATGKAILVDDLTITDPGKHFFYFTGEQLPSGTYYYRIEFPKDERIIVQKAMILVK